MILILGWLVLSIPLLTFAARGETSLRGSLDESQQQRGLNSAAVAGLVLIDTSTTTVVQMISNGTTINLSASPDSSIHPGQARTLSSPTPENDNEDDPYITEELGLEKHETRELIQGSFWNSFLSFLNLFDLFDIFPDPTPAPVPVPKPAPAPTPAPVSACTIPQFVGGWLKGVEYPKTVAEAQGAAIGNDFLVVSGFWGSFSATTKETWAVDMRNLNAQWRKMDELPTPYGITHGAFVVVGLEFYMCGGYKSGHPGQHTKDCLVYDHSKAPGTGQWSFLPDLPDEGRAGGGLVYDKKRNALVFAAGAKRPEPNNAHAVDYSNAWMLDLDNIGAGWVSRANVPYVGNHISYVSATDDAGEQRLYFFGGQVGENESTGNVKDNYEWNADAATWIKRADMPFTRGHAGSSTVAVGCGFIVAGGSTNEFGQTSDISYYHIPSNSWTKIGNLPIALNTPVCAIGSGYLYCESGYVQGKFSYRRQIRV